MGRTVTVVYRSHAVAQLVRDGLERAGIERSCITVLPSVWIVPVTVEASGPTTTRDNIKDALHRLQDLDLSGAEAHACRRALQNGGHVVSVSLTEEAELDRVQQLMDRPGEILDLDEFNVPSIDAAVVRTASSWTAMTPSGS